MLSRFSARSFFYRLILRHLHSKFAIDIRLSRWPRAQCSGNISFGNELPRSRYMSTLYNVTSRLLFIKISYARARPSPPSPIYMHRVPMITRLTGRTRLDPIASIWWIDIPITACYIYRGGRRSLWTKLKLFGAKKEGKGGRRQKWKTGKRKYYRCRSKGEKWHFGIMILWYY